MPDVTYTINYDASSAQKAATQIDALAASITQLEVVVDRVKPKIQGLGTGASRTINATASSVGSLTTKMNALLTASTDTGIALRTVGTQAGITGTALHGAAKGGDAARGSFLGIASSTGALFLVSSYSKAIEEALDGARKYADETAGSLLEVNDRVRELRAVSGDKTTTKEAVASVADMMLKSGMTEQESVAFNVMAGSAISVAKKGGGWKLSEKDTQAVKVEAAKFAVANDISPDTMGRLLGQVGVAQPVTTQDDVLSQISFAHKMGVDSLAKLTPFMKANQALIGEMVRPKGGGAFKSFAEMSGGVSALTSVVKEGRIPQVMRQLQTEFASPANDIVKRNFAKYGIVPGKDDMSSTVQKMGKYLDETRAKGIPDESALINFGIKRAGGRRAIVAAVQARTAFAENVAAAKEADPSRIRSINERFKAENPNRFADASVKVAGYKKGEETADLKVLRQYATAGLRNRKLLDAPQANLTESMLDAKLPLVGSVSQGMFMQEPARLKMLDTYVTGMILRSVPDAQKRFPDLNENLSLNPFASPARGERLAEIIRGLTPEERAALQAKAEWFGATGMNGEAVLRPDANAMPGASANARARNDPSGPEALTIQRQQLEELRALNTKVGGQPATTQKPVTAGITPNSGGDFDGRRN